MMLGTTRACAGVVLAAAVLAAAGPSFATDQAGAVPSSLQAVESSAEDLVDFALAGDRRETVATAAELATRARGPAAASLARAGVAPAKIARLKRTASRVSQLAARGPLVRVALAANAVSGLMPELYAHFHDRVPPSVLTLDYLDREAQLRSLVLERARVDVAVKRLASTWAPLRPKVVAAGGSAPAAAYDKHVSAMKRLVRGSLTAVGKEAVHGLVLVDALEQAFTR
jgi:hypothetical protein